MKSFLTGATGFIGGRVLQKLIARGDTVTALVRSESGAKKLQALGAKTVLGDLNSLEALREGMRGCDVVFHIAAWYKLGARNLHEAEIINVEGTRHVLGAAHELGISKIVYTSTLAIYGDTHGKIVDETYRMPSGQSFVTEYDRTKWMAHYEAALPLIEKGAPVVIVLPGAVYGPGDSSLVGQMMNAYYHGLMAVFPGPETALTFAHVDDIAEAHLLAAEKGRPGESYITAGPALTLRDASKLWAAASGKRPPLMYVPSRWLKPLKPVARLLGAILPMPEMLSADGVAILGATYIARSDKAQAELGWKPRSPEIGFQQTFESLKRQKAS